MITDPIQDKEFKEAKTMIEHKKLKLVKKASEDKMTNTDLYNLCVLNKLEEKQEGNY